MAKSEQRAKNLNKMAKRIAGDISKMNNAEFAAYIKECHKDPKFMKEIKRFIKETTR